MIGIISSSFVGCKGLPGIPIFERLLSISNFLNLGLNSFERLSKSNKSPFDKVVLKVKVLISCFNLSLSFNLILRGGKCKRGSSTLKEAIKLVGK